MLYSPLFALDLLPSQLMKARREGAHPQLNTKLSPVSVCCKPLGTGQLSSGPFQRLSKEVNLQASSYARAMIRH